VKCAGAGNRLRFKEFMASDAQAAIRQTQAIEGLNARIDEMLNKLSVTSPEVTLESTEGPTIADVMTEVQTVKMLLAEQAKAIGEILARLEPTAKKAKAS
jgi:hypothetical protein